MHFWLQFLLKNKKHKWNKDETPNITFSIFDGVGGQGSFFIDFGGLGMWVCMHNWRKNLRPNFLSSRWILKDIQYPILLTLHFLRNHLSINALLLFHEIFKKFKVSIDFSTLFKKIITLRCSEIGNPYKGIFL